ncbi:DUF397 domain-containing protein [Streptomyces palmae]|uniref:DUF397 domain-containing protein n=1 Tax=Streptomyces palmae TaxID=1701085 RepID=A0A4Z0GWJ9_9ACTN|nr:DUF397 domain-containing protein [Streptomyces palmae]TGB01365.1 DUF397 domain-containing protein [Streptomyces palmae]
MTDSAVQWQKSSFSSGGDGGQCLELTALAEGILIRESENPGTVLAVDRAELRAFVRGAKTGEFDRLG